MTSKERRGQQRGERREKRRERREEIGIKPKESNIKWQFHRRTLQEGYWLRWIKEQRAGEKGVSLKEERRRREGGGD